MSVYWTMVLVPALLSLGESARRHTQGYRLLATAVLVALFPIMAFRDTAGDYLTYSQLVDLARNVPLAEGLGMSDPLYAFLNWASANLGTGIYGVNAACALIFLLALGRYAATQPLPLFFLALSVPYFVIVVGMGYTRQGVAAALLLLGLLALERERPFRFALIVLLAAGFHKSALVAIGLLLLADLRLRPRVLELAIRAALVGLVALGLQFMVQDDIQLFVANYVESDRYTSGGALLRSLFTALAAVAFLVWRRRWAQQFRDAPVFTVLALVALALVPLSTVFSTPADRMGLYLLPFQIAVMARLPALQTSAANARLVRLVVLAAYLGYFFTWLHLGAFAQALWVPYQWLIW